MRSLSITAFSLTSTLLILNASQAQLLPFFKKPTPGALSPIIAAGNKHLHQQPMDASPGIQLPPSQSQPPPNSDVILSDVLGSQRPVNIFAGFTRDITTVSSRLDTSSLNTTVLAPVNSAISSLPRKPWEDPADYVALGANAYDGEDGEDRAHRNLRRFTEAHVVPVSPWDEGEKVKSLGGQTLWWEKKEDGKVLVQPGSVEVERVGSRVANGEVWILKGIVNYAS